MSLQTNPRGLKTSPISWKPSLPAPALQGSCGGWRQEPGPPSSLLRHRKLSVSWEQEEKAESPPRASGLPRANLLHQGALSWTCQQT